MSVPAYTRRTPCGTVTAAASQSKARIASAAATTSAIAITARPWPSRLAAASAAPWWVRAGDVEAAQIASTGQGASTSAVVISWSRRRSIAIVDGEPDERAQSTLRGCT